MHTLQKKHQDIYCGLKTGRELRAWVGERENETGEDTKSGKRPKSVRDGSTSTCFCKEDEFIFVLAPKCITVLYPH